MKKITKNKVLLFISLLILGSCSSDETYENDVNSSKLRDIANKYHYKIEKLNSKDSLYTVSSIPELENILQNNNKTINVLKVKSISGSATGDVSKISELINETYANVKEKSIVKKSSFLPPDLISVGGPGSGYTYATMVYFDNSFPAPNVYIQISYNTDANGNIIAGEVSSGTYGYSLGGNYSQIGSNVHIVGGIMVFEIRSQITTSVGLGDFTLSNSNFVNYTGFLNGQRNGGSGGFVKQEPNRNELLDQ